MNSLKILFSKNYWLYIFSPRKMVLHFFAAYGFIWLLVESTSFFSQALLDFFKLYWFWFLLMCLLWAIYKNFPSTTFCYKLKKHDITIQLSIGDLFNYEGDLIIPTNTSFDTSFQNNLISKNSTQGQFTIKYFREPRELDDKIKGLLDKQLSFEELPDKQKGNKYRYEIGTVAQLEINNDKYAYLLASSHMNDSGNTSTNFDDVLSSLGNLWDFILKKGELNQINIPILGTGRGRILENRETIIKAIIHSFISSTSSGKKICEKLNIVIHPRDFVKHEINMNELCDFLRLKCEHY